jgi:outer membrane beta-barrel protein
MKKTWFSLSLCVFVFCASAAFANEGISPSQTDNERTNETVVRNKLFYKPGKFEVSPILGVIPFDSVVNHFLVGGRLTWHFSDHFGWEIADFTLALPSVTSYATSLVQHENLSNLQTNQLKLIVGTNLLFSPMYGKIRFIGNSIVHFDIYSVLGLGFSNIQVLQLTSAGANAAPTQTILKTSWDPTINFGFGFKFFVTNVVGVILDFRDYFTYSEAYGKKRFASHFGANVGLSFFVPPF